MKWSVTFIYFRFSPALRSDNGPLIAFNPNHVTYRKIRPPRSDKQNFTKIAAEWKKCIVLSYGFYRVEIHAIVRINWHFLNCLRKRSISRDLPSPSWVHSRRYRVLMRCNVAAAAGKTAQKLKEKSSCWWGWFMGGRIADTQQQRLPWLFVFYVTYY